jgi:hypothetical protein
VFTSCGTQRTNFFQRRLCRERARENSDERPAHFHKSLRSASTILISNRARIEAAPIRDDDTDVVRSRQRLKIRSQNTTTRHVTRWTTSQEFETDRAEFWTAIIGEEDPHVSSSSSPLAKQTFDSLLFYWLNTSKSTLAARPVGSLDLRNMCGPSGPGCAKRRITTPMRVALIRSSLYLTIWLSLRQ